MGEESNIEPKQLKVFYGFNEDYFKIGQLINVTVKDIKGQILGKIYGFINKVEKEKISFVYINKTGIEEEKIISPGDLMNPELGIKVDIIGV